MSNAFDYISSLNKGEARRVDSDYSPYLTDIFFSLFPDTILVANSSNVLRLEGQKHYDLYLLNIRAKKRYSKWPKKKKKEEAVSTIMQFYKYSRQKAYDVLPIFSEEQIAALQKIMKTGVE